MKKVLIVEDDPDMAEMLHAVLQAAGYVTRATRTGTEALTLARRAPPDLVLLDLILPDANGFTVCQCLRLDPVTTSVPILMISALPGDFPRLVGAETGADAYLHKPFQIQELLTRIELLLQRNPGHADPGLVKPGLAPPGPLDDRSRPRA